MARCVECDVILSPLVRTDALYCSGRCRVRGHRSTVPAEMRGLHQWVRHDRAKRPLGADGRLASVATPATWRGWQEVRRGDEGVGLGFVLDGTGLVCVDLDHALDDAGRPLPWCAELLATCPATWVEVSPSRRGLHVWGRGVVGKGRRTKVGGGGIEVYDRGRFITVTGERFSTRSQLADLTGWLELLPGA